MNTLELTRQIVKTLDAKKADQIEVIEIGDLTIISDYFVIASTKNTTHVKALADEVEFVLKEQGIMPDRIEGYQHANWIILDYREVVVHVFYEETRNFYHLEKLWGDGKRIDVETLLK